MYEYIEVCSTELSSSRRVTMATAQENAEQIHVYRYVSCGVHYTDISNLLTHLLH
jgi:hypothetical protein